MLSRADYVSLRETVKGWNARKLASYGIHWPPKHGWRKKLLTEYETGGKGDATIRAHTPKVKQPMSSYEPSKRTPAEWVALLPHVRFMFKRKEL